VGEVRSRQSLGGNPQQSSKRRATYRPEPVEEDDAPLRDEDPHAVDEQA